MRTLRKHTFRTILMTIAMTLLTPAQGFPSPGQATITGFVTLTLPTFIETTPITSQTEDTTADAREDRPQDEGEIADATPARPEGFVQSEEYVMRRSKDGEKIPVILNTIVPR